MSPHQSTYQTLVFTSIVLASIVTGSNAFVPNQAKRSLFQPSTTTTTRYFFDFLKQDEEKEPTKTSEELEPEKATSEDTVDKIFGFFFGAKEEEPMGMKRFGRGTTLGKIVKMRHVIDTKNLIGCCEGLSCSK